MTSPIEHALFDLLAARGEGKTICPSEVARAVDADNWRRVMPHVRPVAAALAREGRVVITRHGQPVDPDSFKGVWRIRAAPSDNP